MGCLLAVLSLVLICFSYITYSSLLDILRETFITPPGPWLLNEAPHSKAILPDINF